AGSAASRVLLLADHFGYSNGDVHGGTTYFLQLLPALRESGIHVAACILREPHRSAAQLSAYGVDVRFLSAARLDPFVVDPIVRIVREHDCTIVHAPGFKSCLIARQIARSLSIR